MGVFYTSWKFALLTAPQKVDAGWHRMALPCDPHTPIPLVDARRDTGPFVRALLLAEPGVNLLGETSLVSWTEYMRVWGKVLGVPRCEYEEVSVQSYDEAIPGGFGRELADMFNYMGVCGYDGGDPESIRKEQVRLFISCISPPATSVKIFPAARNRYSRSYDARKLYERRGLVSRWHHALTEHHRSRHFKCKQYTIYEAMNTSKHK